MCDTASERVSEPKRENNYQLWISTYLWSLVVLRSFIFFSLILSPFTFHSVVMCVFYSSSSYFSLNTFSHVAIFVKPNDENNATAAAVE